MRKLVAILLFTLWGLTLPAYAQDTSGRLVITNSVATNFPDVSFTARIEDSAGNAITNLGGGAFNIQERVVTGTISAIAENDTPLNLYLIFDTSANHSSEAELHRLFLRELQANVLREGDSLNAIMVQSSGVTTLNNTTVADIDAALRFRDFTKTSFIETAFSQAMNELLPVYEAGGYTRLIFLASYLPSADVSYAPLFNLPLHTVHIHQTNTRTEASWLMQNLATGRFIDFTTLPNPELTNLFNQMNANRLRYRVSYRSQQASQGMRDIAVTVNTNVGAFTDRLEYQKDVVAPEVRIVSSESNFNILREAAPSDNPTASGDIGYSFSKPTEIITANISFPDGILRNLESAALIVDGVQQPLVQVALDFSSNIALEWDVTEFQEGGEKPHDIQVIVNDYFGLSKTSPTQVFNVNVNIPERLTEVIEEITLDPCVTGDRTGVVCFVQRYAQYAIVLQVLTVVAAVVLFVLFWQLRQQIGAGIQKVGGAAIKLATDILINGGNSGGSSTTRLDMQSTVLDPSQSGGGDRRTTVNRTMPIVNDRKTVLDIDQNHGGGQQPSSRNLYAQLVIKQGEGQGSTIYMNTTTFTIGRDEKQGVNKVINSESVSRRHCQLVFDQEKATFTIEDLGSSNGTYINNQRLKADTPFPLGRNTRIRLGEYNPIIMQFIPNERYEIPEAPPTHRSGLGYHHTADQPTQLDPSLSSSPYSTPSGNGQDDWDNEWTAEKINGYSLPIMDSIRRDSDVDSNRYGTDSEEIVVASYNNGGASDDTYQRKSTDININSTPPPTKPALGTTSHSSGDDDFL